MIIDAGDEVVAEELALIANYAETGLDVTGSLFATLVSNVGMVQQDLGGSRAHYPKVAICVNNLGENHSRTVKTRSNLDSLALLRKKSRGLTVSKSRGRVVTYKHMTMRPLMTR